MPATLTFDRGALVFGGRPARLDAEALPGVLWDPRTGCWRAPAHRLASLRRVLADAGIELAQSAEAWIKPRGQFAQVSLRSYQRAAVDAWDLSDRRGLVVLPTGAGKTRVACVAIAQLQVPTLCLLPTRILMHQWLSELEVVYTGGVGCLGDAVRRLRPITVATYESAYRHRARICFEIECGGDSSDLPCITGACAAFLGQAAAATAIATTGCQSICSQP
ncbi:MAG: DEAD/DEAH box helicase family protein [Myxococcales bacterium]|nr:DEAD/DEAH box helicase family protein [Myxococcales bacterium]